MLKKTSDHISASLIYNLTIAWKVLEFDYFM